MTNYVSYTRYINAICPRCKLVFGYVVIDDKVTCPTCKFEQSLPIIMIGQNQFFCIPCQARRDILDGKMVCCVNCGKNQSWNFPI